MDVKTALINGNLEEDVYLIQPKGFVDPNNARKIYKLKKSIYGLNKHLRAGIFILMKWSKDLAFVRMKNLVFIRRKVGALVYF